MRNVITGHRTFSLSVIFTLVFSFENICLSQTNFIIGGRGTWVKKGSPFEFNGIKTGVWDVKCIDGNMNGANFTLVCSKIRGFTGFSFAILFSLTDQMNGLEFSLVNRTTTLKGVQIGVMNQRTHFIKPSMKSGNHGVQIGILNATFTNFGVQFGLYNDSWSANKGISIGAMNVNSKHQLGLINIKKESDNGIQIGLINYQKGNKWYAKVLPVLNVSIKKKKTDNWQ